MDKDTVISLEFSYRSQVYYAVIRIKMIEDEKQYHITIMNTDPDDLLYGHSVIVDQEQDSNEMQWSSRLYKADTTRLKSNIMTALSSVWGLSMPEPQTTEEEAMFGISLN